MAEPLVSVLIPVYNRELLITPCVRSALDQTLRDLEVVIVDNCSTDRTWDVCESLAASDSRVRIFRNETNIGPVRNWMRCAELARGRYAHILFSDDLLMPEALEQSVACLHDQDVGFVVTAVTTGADPETAHPQYTWRKRRENIPSAVYLRTMLAENGDLPVSPGSSLFRLTDVRNHLRPEIPSPTRHDFAGHGAGPDLLLSMLTASCYPAIAHLPQPLAFFRSHEGSITTAKHAAVVRAYAQSRLWFACQKANRRWLDYTFGVAWIQRMRRDSRWIAPSALRAEMLFPTDPQPHWFPSLWSALTGRILPRLRDIILRNR